MFHCHKLMVRPFLQHNCGLSDYEDVEVVMIPEVREEQFRQYLNYVYGLQQEQQFAGTLEEIFSLGYSAIEVKLEDEEDCEPELESPEDGGLVSQLNHLTAREGSVRNVRRSI